MTDPHTEENASLVARVAEIAKEHGLRVAAAESLTSGAVLSALGAGEGASEWFRGGSVAYASEVKFEVLDVDEGPVVRARCAEQMARGVARLYGADVAVSTTGAGGPGPEEGEPAGTVFFGVLCGGEVLVERRRLDGDPPEVVLGATTEALRLLAESLEKAHADDA